MRYLFLLLMVAGCNNVISVGPGDCLMKYRAGGGYDYFQIDKMGRFGVYVTRYLQTGGGFKKGEQTYLSNFDEEKDRRSYVDCFFLEGAK